MSTTTIHHSRGQLEPAKTKASCDNRMMYHSESASAGLRNACSLAVGDRVGICRLSDTRMLSLSIVQLSSCPSNAYAASMLPVIPPRCSMHFLFPLGRRPRALAGVRTRRNPRRKGNNYIMGRMIALQQHKI